MDLFISIVIIKNIYDCIYSPLSNISSSSTKKLRAQEIGDLNSRSIAYTSYHGKSPYKDIPSRSYNGCPLMTFYDDATLLEFRPPYHLLGFHR